MRNKNIGFFFRYNNLFVGDGKLEPIPADYVPREEEYYRHPISRWIAINLQEKYQQHYERKLHIGWEMVRDDLRIRGIDFPTCQVAPSVGVMLFALPMGSVNIWPIG